MGIEIERTTNRGDILPLQLTGSSFGFGYTRITKYITTTLVGATEDAYELVWENVETVPVLVFRVVVNETTAAGIGTSEYVIMGTDADGSGMTGDVFMNGFDANLINTWYDNCYGPMAWGGTTCAPIAYLDENGGTTSFITVRYLDGNCSAFAATVYIFYFPLL